MDEIVIKILKNKYNIKFNMNKLQFYKNDEVEYIGLLFCKE